MMDIFYLFLKIKNLNILEIWHIKAPKKKKKIFDYFDTLIILSAKELDKWQEWHKNIQVIPKFSPFRIFKNKQFIAKSRT